MSGCCSTNTYLPSTAPSLDGGNLLPCSVVPPKVAEDAAEVAAALQLVLQIEHVPYRVV